MSNFETISGDLANLIGELLLKPLQLTLYPRAVKEIFFDTESLSFDGASIDFNAGFAELSIRFKDSEKPFDYFSKYANKTVYARTTDEEDFFAQVGFATYHGIGSDEYFNFVFSDWKLGGENAVLWIGELIGNLPHPILGNLKCEVVSEHRKYLSSGHFLLSAVNYKYYVLSTKCKERNTNTIAVDASGNDLYRYEIFRDMLAMGFAFGEVLDCKQLFAIDINGKIVGSAGANFGASTLTANHSECPIPEQSPHGSIPVLFNKACLAMSNFVPGNTDITKAIKFYVESLPELFQISIENKLFLSIFESANYFFKPEEEIIDSEAWQIWLNENLEKITSIVALKYQDAFNRRLMDCSNLSRMQVIDMAVRSLGFNKTEEIISTVYKTVQAHTENLSSPSEQRVFINKLRTIAIAFISKAIGYKGSIRGWNSSNPHLQMPEDVWWSSEPIENHTSYKIIANIIEKSSDASEIWPSFELPKVPNDGLAALIVNFASSLKLRTSNRVKALVIPTSFGESKAGQSYDFIIQSMINPSLTSTLFTFININANKIKVIGWTSKDITLNKEEDLSKFLKSVATSKRAQEQVERLLIATYVASI